MDINLVSHAKDYIDDLAKGINPFTKEEVNEDDIINAVKPENMKKLKVTAITNWLVSINMLAVIKINNKNIKKVTDTGKDLGLTEEERLGQYGKYYAVTYNKNAQQFIIDNLNSIIDGGFN